MKKVKGVVMEKFKVSLISYLNSRPFLYGLENSPIIKEIDLSLDIPAKTAEKLISNKIDIGLVPVGSLIDLPDYRIIGDFCIGAEGPVRTVILAGDVPVGKMETILMDYQSRSSVLLTKVLAHYFWKREFKWEKTGARFESESIGGIRGGIVIGDRAFTVEKRFPFIYDLASEWIRFSGLPFVFAVWVTRKDLPSEFLEQFNRAVESGVLSVPEVERIEQPHYPGVDVYEYFTRNINYRLDARKKEGMSLFLELGKKLQTGIIPPDLL